MNAPCLNCRHLQRSSLPNSGLYQCAIGMRSPASSIADIMRELVRGGIFITVGGPDRFVVISRAGVLEGHATWPIHFNPIYVEKCTLPR